MGRKTTWTKEVVEEKVIPKLEEGMTVAQVAKFYDVRRQRMYIILKNAGYNHDGSPLEDEMED